MNTGGAGQYAVSDDGTLIFAEPPRRPPRSLLQVDRSGRATPIGTTRLRYEMPRFSPDGAHLAVGVQEESGSSIWMIDRTRNLPTRWSVERGADRYPVWSPNGQWLCFASTRAGPSNLFRARSDGAGSVERLTTAATVQVPQAWSSDGRWIVFTESPQGALDIGALAVDGADRATRSIVATPRPERGGALSPDGRYLAYASGEDDRDDIFIMRFPDAGARWRVSFEGGQQPVWSRNGRELFYRNGNRLMVVDITLPPIPQGLTSRMLFEARFDPGGLGTQGRANYDVAPDGSHFVFVERADPSDHAPHLQVAVNWFEELRRLMASAAEKSKQ